MKFTFFSFKLTFLFLFLFFFRCPVAHVNATLVEAAANWFHRPPTAKRPKTTTHRWCRTHRVTTLHRRPVSLTKVATAVADNPTRWNTKMVSHSAHCHSIQSYLYKELQ